MQVKTTFARQLTGSLADELARVQKDVRGAPGDDHTATGASCERLGDAEPDTATPAGDQYGVGGVH